MILVVLTLVMVIIDKIKSFVVCYLLSSKVKELSYCYSPTFPVISNSLTSLRPYGPWLKYILLLFLKLIAN